MEAIRQLAYCGRCGAPAPGQPDSLGGPFRCTACGFTLYFNAAGAVGAILLRSDGRALFVRRAKDPGRGKLGLPGGFVDPGENAEEALVREVREEVGLEIRSPHYLNSHANRYLYAGVTYYTLDLFFTARTDAADEAAALDAVDAIEWLDPMTVPFDEIAFDSMRAALTAFRASSRRGAVFSVPERGIEPGRMPLSWAESDGGQASPFILQEYNPDFLIIRQSGRTHFEKPFLYLLVGRDRAMLVDTGAPGVDVGAFAMSHLAERRASSARAEAMPLVVAHTHADSDHVAGDATFGSRGRVTLVGPSAGEVAAFFGIRNWPEGLGAIDLGDRVLDVVPIPGHEPASVAFYDRQTGVLLTGDLLYPGRLYVRDAEAFRASVRRLVAFTASRPVAHILGAHVENARTPFVDYPEGTVVQPDEHPLELGRAHLLELSDALDAMPGRIDRRALRDFTIVPVTSG